jgi:transcriptional regulator with XRE-family HTH domain
MNMEANNAENFGRVLKELRKRENLTQESVSDLLNTDRSNIANYESGKRLPPISSLIKIAEFFHVSLDFLVFGKEQTPTPGQSSDGSTNDELMAENTLLMEQQLKLEDELQKKEELIKVQREMLEVLKKYTNVLEEKLKNQDID